MPYISRLGAKESTANRINVAYIAVGGYGKYAAQGNLNHNTVAYCDVDEAYAAETYKLRPEVPRFRDFRKMFDKLGSGIDAVSIATPDHTHYPIAMEAMRRGYHVYLQKPMAHTISQVRTLTKAAEKYEVVTQLGVQGHSLEGLRLLKEWLDAGVIGNVLDVHLWTDRPKSRDYHSYEQDAPAQKVPDTLDWDLFLGPARNRPYNRTYHPVSWRGWWDFGNGPIGDIGVHLFDNLEYCLNLGPPEYVSAQSPRVSKVGTPRWIKVDYFYPARDGRMPIAVHWYSGERNGEQHTPAKLPYWPDGLEYRKDSGMYIVGEHGAIYIGDQRVSSVPRVYPNSLWQDFRKRLPQQTLERPVGSHYDQFFNAIRDHREANCNFAYAGPLSEGVLVGNLAVKTRKTIHWDSKNMRAIGVKEADEFIYSQEPRKGWEYVL